MIGDMRVKYVERRGKSIFFGPKADRGGQSGQ
jgi:hypothetical protein